MMTVRTLIAAAALTLLAAGPVAAAAPCKDAKGRFVKCPTAKPAPTRCRLNGKFVKCGTRGAKPA
jgi:hypothetical protein